MSGPVFISYVREDRATVDRLVASLAERHVEAWLDRDKIPPGTRWKDAIRDGIRNGSFYLACFSKQYASRSRSYVNEELTIAIEELRQRPTDRAWFIPVVLDGGAVPERTIGAGETLRDLQWVDLSQDWDRGVDRIAATINGQSLEPPSQQPAAEPGHHGGLSPTARPAQGQDSNPPAVRGDLKATLIVAGVLFAIALMIGYFLVDQLSLIHHNTPAARNTQTSATVIYAQSLGTQSNTLQTWAIGVLIWIVAIIVFAEIRRISIRELVLIWPPAAGLFLVSIFAAHKFDKRTSYLERKSALGADDTLNNMLLLQTQLFSGAVFLVGLATVIVVWKYLKNRS